MSPFAPRRQRARAALLMAVLVVASPLLALPLAGANSLDDKLGSAAAGPDSPASDHLGGASRLRDGLGEEAPSSTVSVLVKLVGDPIGYTVIDFEARFGPRAAWSAGAFEQASEALRSRNVELAAQRSRVLGALSSAGFDIHAYRDYRTLANGFNLRDVPAALVVLLGAQPDVALVEKDRVLWADLAQSVPLINADDVWALQNATGANITGEGTVIANIDTGVDYTHPDLGGTLNRTNDFANFTNGTHRKFVGGWDFVNNDNDPWDDHLHGTHVAGIIGANGTIKGVAPGSKQLALKVLSGSGYGYDSDIIAAMEYAANPDGNALTDDGADASSMSLGGWDPNPDGVEPVAADTSTLLGTLCVIAAGNSGATSSVGSPGISRESITVGSTTKADVMSGFSSRGPTLTLDIKPDLVAPGSNIVSTRWGGAGGNLTLSGTSMATPHVSGAVALIRQAHPNWTVPQLKSALVDTAKDLGLSVFDQGGGRLDVLAAVSTTVAAYPHKLAMSRLDRANSSTNVTVGFQNLGNASVTLNLSAKDVFGMRHDMSYVNNNTDLDFVSVSPSSITMAPGARANVTVTFAPALSAVPGHYWGFIFANGSNQALHVPFAYSVRAPILLVDDDSSDRWSGVAPFDNFAGFPSACNNFSWSLDRLNMKHDIFTAVHYTDDGPALADLANYPLVIWCTGYDYDYSDSFHTHRSISTRDRLVLASYLDRGGQLWLIGENIAFDVFGHANATVSSSNFFNAYLGVARVDNELNTPNPVAGTPGTFMANASYTTTPSWTDYANKGDYATNLTPTSRAFTIFNGSTTDVYGKSYPNASLAIAVDNATYRSVYWGFEYSWLRTSAAFDDAMSRTLAFFAARIGLMNSTADEGQLLDFRALHSTLPNASMYSYTWNFGDGGNATSRNATHAFADDGNYTVQVRVTAGPWFDQTATMNVTVANLPPVVAAFGALPLLATEGSAVNFTGSCTDPGPLDVVSYSWSFGDASANSTGSNATHAYADEGNFSAQLSCADGDGGLTTQLINVTVINADPQATFLGATGRFEEGSPVTFASSCSDPGALDILTLGWDFGDGVVASGASSVHSFLDEGVYTVTLRCDDGDGGTSSLWTNVTIANVGPSAAIATGSNRTLEGNTLTFTGLASDPGILDVLTFSWEFSDGWRAVNQSVVDHIFPNDGTYWVNLTVDDGDGGRNVVSLQLVIANVPPVATIAADDPLWEGQGAALVVSILDPGWYDFVNLTYAWDFGDGNVTVAALGANSISHVYLQDGQYNVTVTVVDGSDVVRAGLYINVTNALPAVTVNVTGTRDEGVPLLFAFNASDPGLADVLSIGYDLGDGSSGTLEDARGLREISHTYADDGTFNVLVTVNDGDGGSATSSFTIVIGNQAPWFDLSGEPYRTVENSTLLLVSMAMDAGIFDNVSVTWHFDDGTADVQGTQVSHWFPDDGTYLAHLTATDKDGASSTATLTIVVANLPPSLEFVLPTGVVEGSAVTYTAATSDPGPHDIVTVHWDWGDGTQSDGEAVAHTYADVGSYTITVTARDDSNSPPNSATLIRTLVVENARPTVDSIFVLGLLEEGSPLDFSPAITNPANEDLTFAWVFGDGSSSTALEPRHSFADQGAYNVTLTVTDPEGTSSSLSRVLAVENAVPLLACSACPATAVQRVPFSIVLEATDPGASESISFFVELPNHTRLVSRNGTFDLAFADAGSFNLTLSAVDKDGGQANITFTIMVLPDFDGDGIDNARDLDDDGDGTPDVSDPAPLDPLIVSLPVDTPGGLSPWLLLLVGAAGVLAVFLVLRRRRRGDDS